MTARTSQASAVVLRADHVSKRYRIGAHPAPPATRWHALGRWLARPFRRSVAVMRGRLAEASEAELWALRDASFQVRRGEVLGLLGTNGAGKTTLLRLISGITRPTTGQIGIRGRVGSLLEVSIGFHPELTGRENVYLYGAMLGLRRAEVAARFDRIVAFAGLERFLDTQLKFYSTGMYTRLAFSVASELAPDVLLVDEVLSVSDFAFQQRSLGTIARRARQGATVVFVSHNLQAMAALCTRCLVLDQGRVVADGSPPEMIRRYRDLAGRDAPEAGESLPPDDERPGTGDARLREVRLEADPADPAAEEARRSRRLRVRYEVTVPREGLTLTLAVRAPGGDVLGSTQQRVPADRTAAGTHTVVLHLPDLPLRPGEYPLTAWLGVPGGATCDRVDHGLPRLTLAPDGQEPSTAYDPLRPEGPVRLTSTLQPQTPRDPRDSE